MSLVDQLHALEDEGEKLTKELEGKLLKVSRDYDAVCMNLYDKRSASVGNVGGGEDQDGSEEEGASSCKGIQGFWSNVFQRDDSIVDRMGPEDEDILSYLTDVRVATNTEEDGYTLRFMFRPNPFFTNSVLERSDVLATTKLAGKELRFVLAKATSIEWTQAPSGGKQKKRGGKSGKKGKKTTNDEQVAAPDVDVEDRPVVQLQYGQSVLALFNPPNLTDLLPPGTAVTETGALLEEVIAKGDARFGRLQQAILEDRAVAKHIWLDLVPRAGLHFVMAVDQPSYETPISLGLNAAAEQRVSDMLAAQRELDARRADLADELRRLRAAAQDSLDELRLRRAILLDAAPPDAPTHLFWLTVMRNTQELWSAAFPLMGGLRAVTDRDELALRHVQDVACKHTSSRQGLAEPEDLDYLMAPQTRSFRVEIRFAANDFFEDAILWAEFSFKAGGAVATKASGIKWKAGKCISARQRDVTAAGPTRYRPSFFLLFEPTAAASGCYAGKGLMDEHDKLAVARTLRGEVVTRAATLFSRNPGNDGAEERALAEADGEDLMEDTDQEDVEDDDAESQASSDQDLHTRAENAVNKRKKKMDGGVFKLALAPVPVATDAADCESPQRDFSTSHG